MPVRLNITIDEEVYERLKRELPAEGISRFRQPDVSPGPVARLRRGF
jgi:hypothetical protein